MTETQVRWYVGSQNDTLFIINKPPSPSGTDVVWKGRKDVQAIAKVYDGPDAGVNACLLAAAPEMAEILKEVEWAARATGDYIGQNGQLIKRVREILSKARPQ